MYRVLAETFLRLLAEAELRTSSASYVSVPQISLPLQRAGRSKTVGEAET